MRPTSPLSLLSLLALLLLADLALATHNSTSPGEGGHEGNETTNAYHEGNETTHTHRADNSTGHSEPKEANYKTPADDADALLDVVLMLGGSGNLTHFNFRMLRKIAVHLANSLGIGPSGNQVGVVLVQCQGVEPIHLTGDIMELRYKLMGLQRPNDLCLNEHALKRVPVMFRSHGRMKAAHVVVVMSDGKSGDSKLVTAAADELKKDGVVIYTVAVGPDADKEELKDISSSASTVEADNFRDVRDNIVQSLAANIMQTADVKNRRPAKKG